MPDVLDDFEVFPWNSNFETGIKIIDEQHQEIVRLLNKLAGTLVSDDPLEIERVFDELAAYANFHFETEEALWAEYFEKDSWLNSHLVNHSSFLPKVMELKEQHAGKELRDVIQEILRFLIRWLTFHIIDDDKRMAVVIENIKKGMSLEEAKYASEDAMNGSVGILTEIVLTMYDGLSSRALDLLRERLERKKAEDKLQEANEELQKLAITDKLTGLYNRRHFETVFDNELKRARRDKHKLCFIMLDLDYFKKLNDHYGHAQGDVALTSLGRCLKKLCRRPDDFAFRLGGEEFGILMTATEDDAAKKFAEIIRKKVEALHILNADSGMGEYLTISLGGLSKHPEKNDDIDLFMKEADRCLYEAKEGGRNRVVFA